jgi:hypothetical protein
MRQFSYLSSEFYLKSGIIADLGVLVKQLNHLFPILLEPDKKPTFFTVFPYFNFKNPVKSACRIEVFTI